MSHKPKPKPKNGSKAKAFVPKPKPTKSLAPATFGALADLLTSAAVGFFFLAASLLTGKDPLAVVQIQYAAGACFLSLLFALAGFGAKVYSAYIQMKQS